MATRTICDICGVETLQRHDQYFTKIGPRSSYRVCPSSTKDGPYTRLEICVSCAADIEEFIHKKMECSDPDNFEWFVADDNSNDVIP